MLRAAVVIALCLVASVEAKTPSKFQQFLERAKEVNGSLPQIDPKFEPTEACLRDWDTRDVGGLLSADWAARMSDAGGRLKAGTYAGSTHMLGDYDLCLKVKATGWNVTFLGKYYEHNYNAKYFRSYYISALTLWSIGTCAPDTCTTDDVTYLKIIKDELPILETQTPDVTPIREKPEAIAAVCVLGFFGALVLLASLLDYKWTRDGKDSAQNKGSQSGAENGQVNAAFVAQSTTEVSSNGIDRETTATLNDDTEKMQTAKEDQNEIEMDAKVIFRGVIAVSDNSMVSEGGRRFDLVAEEQNKITKAQTPGKLKLALLAFSLRRNIAKVTSAKRSPGSFGCIHGIRLLTMAWILLGHCYQLGFYVNGQWSTVAENYFSQFELMGRWSHTVINEMNICVETFFVMGGCLVAISFMKALSRQNDRPTIRQMLLYYFHRYWRLTPVYMILLMIWACLWRLMISGPNLPTYWPDVDECRNEWWTNIVYLNNFLGSFACMGWTWYLANDFQFYVFSPAVMIPMYMWPIPGIIFLVLCMLGSFGSLVYTFTMIQQEEADWYVDFYIKPWCRYTPYAIGTLLGYIMFKTKCNVKMSKPIVVMYWAFTIAMLSWPVWVTTSSWFPKEAWVTSESTRRISFSLGVSMLIFACTTGYGGLINTFLSWKFFIPLSRLTYIGYLLHPMVLYFFQYNSHQMIYVNDTNALLFAGGVMFYTLAVSFILTLVFEVPMLALEKVIIPKAKKSA